MTSELVSQPHNIKLDKYRCSIPKKYSTRIQEPRQSVFLDRVVNTLQSVGSNLEDDTPLIVLSQTGKKLVDHGKIKYSNTDLNNWWEVKNQLVDKYAKDALGRVLHNLCRRMVMDDDLQMLDITVGLIRKMPLKELEKITSAALVLKNIFYNTSQK